MFSNFYYCTSNLAIATEHVKSFRVLMIEYHKLQWTKDKYSS
jgi:hypothetical protein